MNKEKMYLDYFNNFLTVGAFADYYHISDKEAFDIIKEGRISNHLKGNSPFEKQK